MIKEANNRLGTDHVGISLDLRFLRQTRHMEKVALSTNMLISRGRPAKASDIHLLASIPDY